MLGERFAAEEEFLELALAVLGLALVYSYPALPLFVPALIAVASAFVPHELAHKYVAESMGLRAGFRLSPFMLLASIAICLLTGGLVKVGAAGAVVVEGWAAPEDEGQIAVAGPLANIAVAAFAASLSPASPLLALAALVNSGLAVFNLLPFPPLDGYKVMNWSREIWAAAFAAAIFCAVIVSLVTAQSAVGWLVWP
ncbi:site-2 protease family protein [Infirmifilum sp.]|uniref:site-2 protease family protein n=1 Tax=Infirmifilum sp. TaxID=2856575 RepID=UPI003D1519B3